MTDRHEAALRAALAERDRIWEEQYGPAVGEPPRTTSTVVTRIVEAALAAAEAHESLLCANCWQPMSSHTALAHCREAEHPKESDQ